MKKLKIKNIMLVLFLVLIFILILIVLVKSFTKDNKKKPINNDPVVEKEIKSYGYVLEDNESKYYKETFDKLIDILNKDNIDDEEYARLITTLFITDFYDLNGKYTKNDVGGLQFIHPDIKENFLLNAQSTLYSNVENNVYGDRKQALPSIKDVTVGDITKVKYTYNKVTDNSAYEINVKWTYQKDLGYQSSAKLTLVHVDNKLYIVELK